MWTWAQHWRDLLFLHWQVPPSSLYVYLPSGIELETREEYAWVSLVLFRLKVRPTWLPFLPGLSSLTEVNLRTYVRCQGRPGIYFFSLHANNRFTIRLARLLTPLRYRWARLSYERLAGEFLFRGRVGTPPVGEWSVAFRPVGECWMPAEDSLDAWLLERYRAFVGSANRDVLEGEVEHERWVVRQVELLSAMNGIGREWGLELSQPPDMMHFAEGVAARFGSFHRLVLGTSEDKFCDKSVGETSYL